MVGGFKVSSPIFQTQQFREFVIEYNIGLKRSKFPSKMRPREAKPNRAGAFSEMEIYLGG